MVEIYNISVGHDVLRSLFSFALPLRPVVTVYGNHFQRVANSRYHMHVAQ